MKEHIIHDNKLGELVKKSGISPAPADFTQNVMERIRHEPVPEVSLARTLFSRQNGWIIAIIGITITGFVIFLLNWSPFDLNPDNIDFRKYEKMVPFFQSLVQGLSKSFAFLTRSSLPLIIAIGTVLLVLLDKVIRKLTLRKSYLF
jgi:hypothetical protein